jgi:hypothetical protein
MSLFSSQYSFTPLSECLAFSERRGALLILVLSRQGGGRGHRESGSRCSVGSPSSSSRQLLLLDWNLRGRRSCSLFFRRRRGRGYGTRSPSVSSRPLDPFLQRQRRGRHGSSTGQSRALQQSKNHERTSTCTCAVPT